MLKRKNGKLKQKMGKGKKKREKVKKIGRNWQRREEIGKKGGKVTKWVLKFSFSSPLRPLSCSLCSLEWGPGKINKIKMTRE